MHETRMRRAKRFSSWSYQHVVDNNLIINFTVIYNRVKNKLLPRIRTFRKKMFFMLCVILNA
jgi:hypothetical protein